MWGKSRVPGGHGGRQSGHSTWVFKNEQTKNHPGQPPLPYYLVSQILKHVKTFIGLVNLIEGPINPGKPADTHMDGTVLHVTDSVQVSAACVRIDDGPHHSFTDMHLYSTKRYNHITLLLATSEILSVPKPVFFVLFCFNFTVSMKKKY